MSKRSEALGSYVIIREHEPWNDVMHVPTDWYDTGKTTMCGINVGDNWVVSVYLGNEYDMEGTARDEWCEHCVTQYEQLVSDVNSSFNSEGN